MAQSVGRNNMIRDSIAYLIEHLIGPLVGICANVLAKGAITSKIKHAIKHKSSPATLAHLLQPSLDFVLACSQ